MARAVNRSHWGLVSSVAWRNMPGRAVSVTACRRLASVRIRCQVHPEVFSAIAFADDRGPLAG
jgi:hypothetical protein